MTIKKLIKKLEKYPEDSSIVMLCYDFQDHEDRSLEIKSIEYDANINKAYIVEEVS